VHLDAVQAAAADSKGVKVAGIAISSAEREVYPGEGISKLEVVRYYERVGENMMPYVAGRPLAVLRGPEGISGGLFFQKSFSTHVPHHVMQGKLPDGTEIFHIRKPEGLVALAQYGVIEFHPWGARLPAADRPDILIWDLDPDASVPWPEVQGTAVLLRDYLADLGLETVVKTSGGKGLHIMLHVKRGHGWDVMREFAKAVAREVATFNPKRLITTATKAKRSGKIYIDWMRNGRGATCIAPWSLRARPGASVSMPINWKDLQSATAEAFTIRDSLKIPTEWRKPPLQTVTVAALRQLGVR
jgi:bifunctional non-homologous end joining protein LigD